MEKQISKSTSIQIEWICMQIFVRLLRRHLRYLVVITPMYLRSIYAPFRCHVLRAAYCFARYLDDILDGDIAIQESPKQYVCQLLEQIKNGPLDRSDHYIILGRYVYKQIDRFADNETLPSHELDKLIQAMIFDRDRADRRMILDQRELNSHHLATFMSALQVTLDITGARYEVPEIEPLARAQGSLYTLRDLEKDLGDAINNIPQDVLNRTNLAVKDYWNYELLRRNRVFKKWIKEEFNKGSMQLARIQRLLDNKNDFNFNATVKPLYWGLSHLSRELQRRYGFL